MTLRELYDVIGQHLDAYPSHDMLGVELLVQRRKSDQYRVVPVNHVHVGYDTSYGRTAALVKVDER